MKSKIAQVYTTAFNGIEPVLIDVQIHIGPGLPIFSIVGLPDKSIGEAKERIRAVFNVIGLSLPPSRITINMSPASLQKEGSHYDLPIATGILIAMGLLPEDFAVNAIIIGELQLNGSLEEVPGTLISALMAYEKNFKLICPAKSANQAYLIKENLNIVAINNLTDLFSYVKGEPLQNNIKEYSIEDANYNFDMSDVKGQLFAKKGLEIAAIGNFHILMIGPPGVGKSMLAKRMITILPELSPEECLEVTIIQSISNQSEAEKNILKRKRPYRDPHHSASLPALIGGGSKAKPGEITLAHNGVLFLDELGQYSKALEGLRECMETEKITISRAQHHITYPAKTQIIAAMNPCKCGYYGTAKGCFKANCAKDYQAKISGPILDRFDLIIHMDEFDPAEQSFTKEENSLVIKERILQAINFQKTNFNKPIKEMKEEELLLNSKAKELLIKICKKQNSSHRAYMKIAKIARAIANLNSNLNINESDISQAFLYKQNLIN